MQSSLDLSDMQCSEKGCELEVEYGCQCTTPQTRLCKLHWMKHCELPNRDHVFESIFLKPYQGTKEAILEFLERQLSENEKSRNNLINSFSLQLSNSEESFEDLLKKLNSDSAEIKNCFKKISEAKKLPRLEQDPTLNLLALSPDEAIEKIKAMLSYKQDSSSNINLFYGLSEQIEKIAESIVKNKLEIYLEEKLSNIEKTLEKHDKIINSTSTYVENIKESISNLLNKNEKSKKEFEDWKQEIEAKTKNSVSLCNSQYGSIAESLNIKISNFNKNQLNFKKWRPEIQIQEKSLNLSENFNSEIEQDSLSVCSLYESDIVSTPESRFYYQDNFEAEIKNKYLYLFEKNENKKTDLHIFDTEHEIEDIKVLSLPDQLGSGTCVTQLPSGKLFCYGKSCPSSGISLVIDSNFKFRLLPSGTPCCYSSAVYFNRNIYCFGGWNDEKKPLALSERFDMNENRWTKLSPLPNPDCCCHTLVFKKNILISGSENKNLLRYSIVCNLFTILPFEFAERKRKIMINAVRLYLIECGGFIYESEIDDEKTWKIIATSAIADICPWQVYCTYSKGAMYIGCRDLNEYYKFSLYNKKMIALFHNSQ